MLLVSEVRQKKDKMCGICTGDCKRVIGGLLNGALFLYPPPSCFLTFLQVKVAQPYPLPVLVGLA